MCYDHVIVKSPYTILVGLRTTLNPAYLVNTWGDDISVVLTHH